MIRKFVGAALVAIASCAVVATEPAFAADSTTTTRPNQNALKSYQQCMKAHGVKLNLPTNGRAPGNTNSAPPSGFAPPTGGTGGGDNGNFPRAGFANLKPKGVSTKKYNAAQKACADKLPSFAGGGPGGQNSQDFQAYLSCLSDHGVKVPSNGGIRNLDPNDETFKAANQTCGALLPQGVAPGSNTSNSAST
jgi:hypothetical protein